MKLFTLILLSTTICAADPRREIDRLREEWGRDLHDKLLDRSMSLYAEDAVFYDPGGAHSQGKNEIRALFAKVTQAMTSAIVFHPGRLEVSGRLAYESGDYSETLTDTATGAETKVRGSYLMVLRREADGRWRIVRHMWTFAPVP
jgi:uncharacterized protein (TIGR02246 family)